jgi:hypothetical protein
MAGARRLGDVAGGRRAAVMALARQRDEELQMTDVHSRKAIARSKLAPQRSASIV